SQEFLFFKSHPVIIHYPWHNDARHTEDNGSNIRKYLQIKNFTRHKLHAHTTTS
ncbi:hypothetical protein SK128_022387, partial [Halocaridina rubra]